MRVNAVFVHICMHFRCMPLIRVNGFLKGPIPRQISEPENASGLPVASRTKSSPPVAILISV